MTSEYIVGLDNGGTANKFTVMHRSGRFLIDDLIELPSRVTEGPGAALAALQQAFDEALRLAGIGRDDVAAVGFDSPGPASAVGVLSSKGATNFAHRDWWGFDYRTALERLLGLPVIYSNDTNAAALYAHHRHFGPVAGERSSAAAIVGTGLGGGVIHEGRMVKGAAGMAGELGHVQIPTDGLLGDGQPIPRCNCGFSGDAESFASLTGIRNNSSRTGSPSTPTTSCTASSRERAPNWSVDSVSVGTRWRCGSSSSRRERSVGCSRSCRTWSTPTSTSSVVASSKPNRTSVSGS
jgi:glucokinase